MYFDFISLNFNLKSSCNSTNHTSIIIKYITRRRELKTKKQ